MRTYVEGPFDITLSRIDDKVTMSIWNKGEVIVEVGLSRYGTVKLIEKIMGVLY